MRLVVDTNVFVSAALKENSLPFLVVRWIEQNHGLLKSDATEQQLLTVLARPRIAAMTLAGLRDGIARMLAAAEFVPIIERVAACRDPTDDKFLELAINGRADLVVSGDHDLLALDPFRNIPIVTPAAFMRRVLAVNPAGSHA
jgi:putative PIN family toxin of toxin-antitoxin system